MNGLYIAASGAASQVQALDVMAHNLANADTPGFRKFSLSVEAEKSDPSPFEFAYANGGPQLDMSQGPVRRTDNPLDVAVVGTGFIRVQTPNGEAYTRDGQLQVTPNGKLLAGGQPVINAAGGTLQLPAGKITIAGDGTISVDGNSQGQIAIAEAKGATLRAIGDSLYRNTGDRPLPEATGGTELRQGFLEQSTANSVTGVVDLMSIMRNYEAAMRAVQTIDERQEKAIQTFTLQA